jgi:MFS family permease
MLRLLTRRPAFGRLWLAGTVSLVGDWLSFVAVSLLALDRSGGPLALALLFAAHSVPRALLAPVAGPVADRFDRRRLLLAAAITQAAITFAMALAAATGRLGAVQALVLARSAVSAFVVPAEAASVALLVEPEELLAANALTSATWSTAFVAGMALGGALALLGPTLAIALDGASFLGAAAILASLPPLRPGGVARALSGRELAGAVIAVPRDLLAVARYAAARAGVARFVLIKSPVGLASGAGWLVLNLVAARDLPLGTAALSLGVLQAVRGTGTGVGPLAAEALVRRGRSRARLLDLASLASLVLIAVFPIGRTAVALGAIALLWGVCTGANWVLSTAELQRRADERFLGRLASLDDLGVTLAAVAGALGAAALVEAGRSPPEATIGIAAASLVWLVAVLAGTTAAEPREANAARAE